MLKPAHLLDTDIVYLKGIGPKKADLLRSELGLHTFRDLLYSFPFRYIDKTKFHAIHELTPDSGEVQIKGVLRSVTNAGEGRKKRLHARLRNETGAIELVWFKGASYFERLLQVGREYVVYGRVNEFNGRFSIAHPDIEEVKAEAQTQPTFAPVYSSTDKLTMKGMDARGRRKLAAELLRRLQPKDLPENLPDYLLAKLHLPERDAAIRALHFPSSQPQLDAARRRMKFEELFFLQLRLLQIRKRRKDAVRGFAFSRIGPIFNQFFRHTLPFELTGAQKRVVREIRQDLGVGVQMNRLLQGDVGSGKTMVGLLCMLIALDNGFQACLMAPTEILAQQHATGISEYLAGTDVRVEFLSGSVKGKRRKALLADLLAGEIDILIGTHALIEPWVVFKNLGLALIDEQHRFGVKQRAALWKKSTPFPPHVLVMTATPIPRTLAMTLYGDLDVSVIDELPPGRKPVTTRHYTENQRQKMFGEMRAEIAKGHQVYVVYPLIEENEKLELASLMEGYEALSREFPKPKYQLSIVHGKMKPADKDYEMQRFVRRETQIMVATTVIEVGVNVPNASYMVIENTERFGLSQLHQLRGRVGRGADQSYCILMSSFKLTHDGRERIQTMVRTTNGFEIAEADLKLRGPGNMLGLQQSGVLNLKIADLGRDSRILQAAREIANRILDNDPTLEKPVHAPLRAHLERTQKIFRGWSRIS